MARPKKKWRENTASSTERGYGARWRKSRLVWLTAHPLCAMCLSEGQRTVGTVVDHVIPHNGDKTLFWDTGNWQTLCEHHHNSSKQIEECSDPVKQVNKEGLPTHPDHPWNDPRWNE